MSGKRVLIRDDLSGKVEKVNTGLLTLLLDAGYTPVVSPRQSHTRTRPSTQTRPAAAAIAEAMGAEALVLLSNVPGCCAPSPTKARSYATWT